MQIIVQGSEDEPTRLEVKPLTTGHALKELVRRAKGIPSKGFTLTSQGQELLDEMTLEDAGITEAHTVRILQEVPAHCIHSDAESDGTPAHSSRGPRRALFAEDATDTCTSGAGGRVPAIAPGGRAPARAGRSAGTGPAVLITVAFALAVAFTGLVVGLSSLQELRSLRETLSGQFGEAFDDDMGAVPIIPSASTRLRNDLDRLAAASAPEPEARQAASLLWSYKKFIGKALRSRRMWAKLPSIFEVARGFQAVAELGSDEARQGVWLQQASNAKDPQKRAEHLQGAWVDDQLEMVSEKLAGLLMDLRGVWPKAAQILSTRSDVLRWPQVRSALQCSYDHCAPFEEAEVVEVLDEEWPGWSRDYFLGGVLGTGSVGQVHELIGRYSGESYVLKVVFQKFYLKMAEDFGLLKSLADNDGKDEVSKLLREMWLCLEDSTAEIANEFDLLHEAEATRAGRAVVAKAQTASATALALIESTRGIRLPRFDVVEVMDLWLGRSTMVQQRAEGIPLRTFLADVQPPAARIRAKTAYYEAIFELWGRMIFEENFFHADPHPGQFLYDAAGGHRGRLWLLDWGLVQQMPEQTHRKLCQMYSLLGTLYEESPLLIKSAPGFLRRWLGSFAAEEALTEALKLVHRRFYDKVADAMLQMGFSTKHNNSLILTATALSVFDTAVQHADVAKTRVWQGIDPLQGWPSDVLIFFRATQTLGGLTRDLHEDGGDVLSSVRAWRPHAQRCVARYNRQDDAEYILTDKDVGSAAEAVAAREATARQAERNLNVLKTKLRKKVVQKLTQKKARPPSLMKWVQQFNKPKSTLPPWADLDKPAERPDEDAEENATVSVEAQRMPPQEPPPVRAPSAPWQQPRQQQPQQRQPPQQQQQPAPTHQQPQGSPPPPAPAPASAPARAPPEPPPPPVEENVPELSKESVDIALYQLQIPAAGRLPTDLPDLKDTTAVRKYCQGLLDAEKRRLDRLETQLVKWFDGNYAADPSRYRKMVKRIARLKTKTIKDFAAWLEEHEIALIARLKVGKKAA